VATLSTISFSRTAVQCLCLPLHTRQHPPSLLSLSSLQQPWLPGHFCGSHSTCFFCNKQTNKQTITKTSTLPRAKVITQHDAMNGVKNWCQTSRCLLQICAMTSRNITHFSFVNFARFKQLYLGNHSGLDTCSYEFYSHITYQNIDVSP
jgi:hypothetical protein